MIKIYSHNFGESSKLLAKALSVKILKKRNSKWRPSFKDIVINWGSSTLPQYLLDAQVINFPSSVDLVSDKKKFFEKAVDGSFNYPLFWTQKEEAKKWLLENPGRTLVCRTSLRGHGGEGIIFCDNPSEIPLAPLYTEYIKKKYEFRVHVLNGHMIDVTQKKRKAGFEGTDHRIRNTNNGYIFARTNIVVPETVIRNAIKAVEHYGLDFGAVDVIYNERQEKAYVLEINTAPGIEGTTLQKYKESFEEWLFGS